MSINILEGLWYEIARSKSMYDRKDNDSIYEFYINDINDEKIEIINTFFLENKKISMIKYYGIISDMSIKIPLHWSLKLFETFNNNIYEILKYDSKQLVILLKKGNHFLILSHNNRIKHNTYVEFLNIAKENGCEICDPYVNTHNNYNKYYYAVL